MSQSLISITIHHARRALCTRARIVTAARGRAEKRTAPRLFVPLCDGRSVSRPAGSRLEFRSPRCSLPRPVHTGVSVFRDFRQKGHSHWL
jgi:hypothetical protein